MKIPQRYVSRRENFSGSYSRELTRKLALVLAHEIDHKHIDPKQIDRQPTKFLSELYCQKPPIIGHKSLYFLNPKIIPRIQESHQQEVVYSSSQAPEIASFPKSISMEDNGQGKSIHRLEPGVFSLVDQGMTSIARAGCPCYLWPEDYDMCHVPVISACFFLPSFPNESFVLFIQFSTNFC